PAVSQRHAYLQVIAGRVFCVDLLSRSGLHRDGTSLRSGWLGGDQVLGIGPFRVPLAATSHAGSSAGADLPRPLVSCPAQPDSLPAVGLECDNGITSPVSWPMNRVLALVGRAPVCKLRVTEPGVARVHCSLLRTSLGVWVISLLGQEGVFVNGSRVRCARLDEGDQFQGGGVTIRVRQERGQARLPPPVPRQLPPPPTPSLPVGAGWHEPGNMQLPTAPALANNELAAVLAPLASQFSLMQQQMFDQFTQAMLMMGQMFSQMHTHQFGLLRQ